MIVDSEPFNRAFHGLFGEIAAITGKPEQFFVFVSGRRIIPEQIIANIDTAASALATKRRTHDRSEEA